MIPEMMILVWEVVRRRPEAIEDFRIPEPIPKPTAARVSWRERLGSILGHEPKPPRRADARTSKHPGVPVRTRAFWI